MGHLSRGGEEGRMVSLDCVGNVKTFLRKISGSVNACRSGRLNLRYGRYVLGKPSQPFEAIPLLVMPGESVKTLLLYRAISKS